MNSLKISLIQETDFAEAQEIENRFFETTLNRRQIMLSPHAFGLLAYIFQKYQANQLQTWQTSLLMRYTIFFENILYFKVSEVKLIISCFLAWSQPCPQQGTPNVHSHLVFLVSTCCSECGLVNQYLRLFSQNIVLITWLQQNNSCESMLSVANSSNRKAF